MAQTRFINFGDTVLASRLNEITQALVVPGVLEGAALSVGVGDTVVVGPNKVMLNDLLLVEDSSTSLAIANLPTIATDYTIVYEHTDQQVQGGVPAQMLIKEGLFGFESLTDTVVLGWVRWPGGGGGLSTTMFIEAPKLQITNPSEFVSDVMIPPFVPRIHVQTPAVAGLITATDTYEKVYTPTGGAKAYMLVTNAASVLDSIVYYVPFVAGVDPPNKIILEVDAEAGASVQAALVDEYGTSYAATLDTITNTSGLFVSREMQVNSVDTTKFSQNRPYFVSLTTQLSASKTASISLVGTSSNFLPV